MRRAIAAALVACSLTLAAPALGHDTAVDDRYEDATMHPLRLAYYAIHPIGFAAEWLIGRPFQYIISREQLRNVFGWEPLSEESRYRKLGERI